LRFSSSPPAVKPSNEMLITKNAKWYQMAKEKMRVQTIWIPRMASENRKTATSCTTTPLSSLGVLAGSAKPGKVYHGSAPGSAGGAVQSAGATISTEVNSRG